MIKKISLLSLVLILLFGLSGCAKLPFDLPVSLPFSKGETKDPTQIKIENLEATMQGLIDGAKELSTTIQNQEKEIKGLEKKVEELEKIRNEIEESKKQNKNKSTFYEDEEESTEEESQEKDIDESREKIQMEVSEE